jgi:competence protein ComEC
MESRHRRWARVQPSWISRTTPSGRLALLAAASFSAGIALPDLPWRDAPALAVPLVLLSVLLRREGARFRTVAVALAAGAAVALAHAGAAPLGDLLASWSDHGFRSGVTPVELQGRVLDLEVLPEGRIALLVRLKRVTIPGRPPYRMRVTRSIVARLTSPLPDCPAGPFPRPGDLVDMTARLGPPRNFRNPGAFDYVAHLRARHIDLVGSVKSARLVQVLPGRRSAIHGLLPKTRRAIVAALGRAAGPGEETTVSFLSALLVGERDDLPAGFEETLIRAGVYHIVALSGFNVALVAGLVSIVLRLLPLPPRARRCLLGLAVLSYWAVARASGSIARAGLMALVYLLGAVLARRVSGIGSMASASVILLCAAPGWIRDAGFQLSLAATLGILVVAPSAGGRPSPGPLPAGHGARPAWAEAAAWWLASSLRVSAAALAGTALVSARHFQALTPIALVANLFAVPLAGALLLLALLACALEAFWHTAAGLLLGVCGVLVALLERLCAFVAAAKWCSFHVVPPPLPLVLLGLVAVAGVGLGRPAARRAALALLVGAVALTAARGRTVPGPGRLEIALLDVGQGDAIVVRFPGGTTMLVDAGGFARSRFDVGARVVAPALRAMGILKLDLLAITHAHRDHLGGASAIVRQFSPAAIWLGRMPQQDAAVGGLLEVAARQGIPVLFPRRGVLCRIDGTNVEVLNPGPGVVAASAASNNDSLVLRIALGRRRVLLTGDLERELETILIEEGRDLAADLLKIGHHGSRTSTSAPFLLRVQPQTAALSVGAANPWGHPDRDVVLRLAAAGIALLRTDRDGALLFTTDGRAPWTMRRLTGDAAGTAGAIRSWEPSE